MKKLLLSLVLTGTFCFGFTQSTVSVKFTEDSAKQIIPKEIYGHFAEHLGRCIYDGIWVGPDSKIPNIKGYRKDIVEALKALDIPVLRWPGGCFADTYHWMDGVGPVKERPHIKNVFWGGTMEDNSFGTHEFFNLCELLGCEPYLSANVGSGSVEEMTDWLEYITSTEDTPMANLRRKNGRQEPWHLKYVGVGNESWGCGGDMTPDHYANLYRQYSGYCRLYGPQGICRVASGANAWHTEWTDVVMREAWWLMEAISVHYYTLPGSGWRDKGPSLGWGEDLYFNSMKNGLKMDDLISRHEAAMDKYDKNNRVSLFVDEWGIWTDVIPGTIPGHLFQQNTMRDALVASTTLDIFHQHLERVKMANIAQVVNVLQAMILTSGDTLVLTPTYHVFNMYKVHMGAHFLPVSFESPIYQYNNDELPAISCTVSEKDGKINISVSNIDPVKTNKIEIPVSEIGGKKVASSSILTSKKFNDYNSFKNPEQIKPAEYKGYSIAKGSLSIELPPLSVIAISVE